MTRKFKIGDYIQFTDEHGERNRAKILGTRDVDYLLTWDITSVENGIYQRSGTIDLVCSLDTEKMRYKFLEDLLGE